MEVTIGMSDVESIRSLYEWFMDDPDMRRGAEVGLVAPASGLQLISLLVNSGFNAASLAVAIAAWRSSRTSPPPLRVEINDVAVVVDGSAAKALENITKVMEHNKNR